MQSRPEVIDTTIARVLEEWAMMIVEPQDFSLELFDADEPVYICATDFKGIVSGSCFLACQASFGMTLVENLTAGAGDQSELDDALREALNVLSGNLLTEAYGASHAFDLTPPVISSIDVETLPAILKGHIAAYLGDDQPVVMSFVER